MPIGKNAIKRVSSSHSAVKSTAPDMENSVAVEVVAEEAANVPAPVTTVKEAPKQTAKKPAKKKSSSQKQEFSHIAIGDDLPYYLL